ncbi:hypothetical protein [Luteirhabdus pelagi]|uniref:hypothetical protein n=1 Tax=Luteirhabdus pelagi TaxID=2792783 RepID=UPI0019399B7C|nr:hypothetical protein [Luteirhabdus pelagi]
MKKIYNISFLWTMVLLVFLALFSCQREEQEIIDETDEEDTITANSVLTNLLVQNAAAENGQDNSIDGNSCTSIVYPITVIVNGTEVTLTSENDFPIVGNILNQSSTNTDTVEIIFPITLQFSDYSTITVSNQSELLNIIDDCADFPQDLLCLDFVYPITFFVYDANLEETTDVSITSDIELYQFLSNLDEDLVLSISFPLEIVLQDGGAQTVNSNTELTSLLQSCVDNLPVPSEIVQTISTGVWYVNYYFDDFEDTETYQEYQFSFATDSTAHAYIGNSFIIGSWEYSISPTPECELNFGSDDPLNEFNEDWNVLQVNDQVISLQDESSDDSIDSLVFGREPSEGNNATLNEFIQNLTTDIWFVTLFEEDGDDETSNYNGYEFTFETDNSALADNGVNQIQGSWTVVPQGDDFIVEFDFDSSGSGNPLGDLDDYWLVLNSSMEIIEFAEAGSGSPDTFLTLEREPNNSTPDPQELRNILETGTWYVDTFLDAGENETAVFYGFNFTFNSNGTVTAIGTSETVNGIWSVSVLGDILVFELDMDSPINDADDDDYETLSFSATEVTFVIRDSSNNIEDTLIFKQN